MDQSLCRLCNLELHGTSNGWHHSLQGRNNLFSLQVQSVISHKVAVKHVGQQMGKRFKPNNSVKLLRYFCAKAFNTFSQLDQIGRIFNIIAVYHLEMPQ